MEHSLRNESVNRAMEIIDKVFLVVFARYRRKVGDSDVSAAWRGASNKVTGFLVLPVAAFMVLIALTFYWIRGIEAPIDQHDKFVTQVGAVVIGLAIIALLERRFKKYLLSPPALTSEESRDERMLVIWFRAIAISSFVLVCLIGVFWRKAGVSW